MQIYSHPVDLFPDIHRYNMGLHMTHFVKYGIIHAIYSCIEVIARGKFYVKLCMPINFSDDVNFVNKDFINKYCVMCHSLLIVITWNLNEWFNIFSHTWSIFSIKTANLAVIDIIVYRTMTQRILTTFSHHTVTHAWFRLMRFMSAFALICELQQTLWPSLEPTSYIWNEKFPGASLPIFIWNDTYIMTVAIWENFHCISF